MGLNRSNNRGSEWDRLIWGLFAKKIGGIMIGDGWKLWTRMCASLYFSNSKLHGRLSPVDDGDCRGSSGTFFLNFVEIHPEGGGWISPGRFTHSVRAVGILRPQERTQCKFKPPNKAVLTFFGSPHHITTRKS